MSLSGVVEYRQVVGRADAVTAGDEGRPDARPVLDVLEPDELPTDAVGIGSRQVLEHLKTLVERGYLAGEIDGSGYTWRDDGIHRVNEHGDAELGAVDLEELPKEDTDELARSSIYTGESVKPRGTDPSTTDAVAMNEGEAGAGIVASARTPPDPGD